MNAVYHPRVQQDVSHALRHYDQISVRLGDDFWKDYSPSNHSGWLERHNGRSFSFPTTCIPPSTHDQSSARQRWKDHKLVGGYDYFLDETGALTAGD